MLKRITPFIGIIVLAMGITACGATVDSAMSKAEEETEKVVQDVQDGAQSVQSEIEQAVEDVVDGAQEVVSDSEKTVFTQEELAAYDGKDGEQAYVAVDGVVYDVTNVNQWKGGTHNGLTAGNDLSEEINESPHGKSVLEKLPVVGSLSEG